jgi:hypothetical protein
MRRISFSDYDARVMARIDETVAATVDDLCGRLSDPHGFRCSLWRLALCERVYPNYAVVSRKHGIGNAAALRQLMDEEWESLSQTRELLPPAHVSALLAQANFSYDDQSDLLMPCAENVLSVCDVALRRGIAQDRNPLKEALAFVLDEIVWYFMSSCFDGGISFTATAAQLFISDLWVDETTIQSAILDKLLTVADEVSLIRAIRQVSQNGGAGSIVRLGDNNRPSSTSRVSNSR